jgi:hypothetical protein
MLKTLYLNNKNSFAGIIFIVALILVAISYNYHEMVRYKPQSVHKWRQSDCASIALNYYQGGMHIFKPEVHNLTSKTGTSGLAYTSELPLYYYAVAVLYKLVGPNDSVYRLLNTLLFLLGLYYLHKLFLLVTNNVVWSILLPLLFFTSPVLVYYGNNFLTNSSALAFTIVGWYYFVKYVLEKRTKWFLISLLVFFFAASFKITAFISFLSIGALLFLEIVGVSGFSKGKKLFNKPVLYFALMVLIVGIIASWIGYAHIQNVKNGCTYFSTITFPIWDLDKEGISKVFTKIKTIWIWQYFHWTMHAFLSIAFFFVVYNFKRLPLFVKWILSVVFIEVIAFILLQFWTFADHDYYTIGLYIFPVLLTLASFYLLKMNYAKLFESRYMKIAVGILLVFNVFYAKGEINMRYHSWWNDIEKYKDVYSLEPYLRQLGINPTDTVVSIPDYCHATLYLMNQKGWTEYTEANFNKGARYKYNSDSTGIADSKTKGANYLIVNGINNLYEKEYLQHFSYKLLGRYKNVLIFDLNARDTNFTLVDPPIIEKLFCNAEVLSTDDKFYENDSVFFEYGHTQTNTEAFSGEYACMLNELNPYGMTIKINDHRFGERFSIKAWQKKSTQANGVIVCSVNGQSFYENDSIDTAVNGWQKFESNLFISEDFVGSELVIFLYNPSKDPVYFDDFEISRYQSVFDYNLSLNDSVKR